MTVTNKSSLCYKGGKLIELSLNPPCAKRGESLVDCHFSVYIVTRIKYDGNINYLHRGLAQLYLTPEAWFK